MKKSRKFKIVVLVVIAAFVLQAGIIAYSMIGSQKSEDAAPLAAGNVNRMPAVSPEQQDTANIEISQEIQDIIKNSDPKSFEKNIASYRQLLASLYVHEKFKNEIENMLKAGHKLPDILTAYTFLNDAYGKLEELQNLVKQKESGKKWASIFEGYNKANPEFVPKSFDSDYLESIMKISALTPDDIMMADRISQKTSVPFKDIIENKISGASWKNIKAASNIINGQDKLSHVVVTPEQIKKYTTGSMTEDAVIQALVSAQKLGENPEAIINKVKDGYTREKIYAESYEKKYY